MEPEATRFDSPHHLAEVATSGVQANLALGEHVAAAALQPVASAAWTLVDEPGATAQLEAAARSGLRALRLACGMGGERRFLQDVVAFCESHRESPNGAADDASGHGS